MSHLDTAYKLGALQANITLEKQANPLKSITGRLQNTPHLLKQLGVGASLGAVPGALAGGLGEEASVQKTLLGALLGAGAGAAGGRLVGQQLHKRIRPAINKASLKKIQRIPEQKTIDPEMYKNIQYQWDDLLREEAAQLAFPTVRGTERAVRHAIKKGWS